MLNENGSPGILTPYHQRRLFQVFSASVSCIRQPEVLMPAFLCPPHQHDLNNLALSGKRIFRGLVLNPQWRALQLERLQKIAFKITRIRRRNMLQGVAMHHDNWRIAAALVRIAQLRPEQAMSWWRLLFHRRNQYTRQLGGCHFGHCCGISPIHRR